ncbi:MAG: hypothetical protein ACRD3M_05760 [Thermoanaerobaculia bacterium]
MTDRRDAERYRDENFSRGRIEDEPPCQPATGDESGHREDEEGQKMSKEEERGFDEVTAFD